MQPRHAGGKRAELRWNVVGSAAEHVWNDFHLSGYMPDVKAMFLDFMNAVALSSGQLTLLLKEPDWVVTSVESKVSSAKKGAPRS